MISDVPELAGDLYVKAELQRTDPKWKGYEVVSSCVKHNSDGALDPVMPTAEATDKCFLKGTSRRRVLFLKCDPPNKNTLGEMEISPVVQVLFPCNDSCGESS